MSAAAQYEAVIGLEIHVQLATATKLFCGDSTEFGAPPNTHVCPVCLGLPGALPVTNAQAVELAVTTALGLGCTVHGTSVFARKNYFYPDLPKGYQITQFEQPIATDGHLDVAGEDGAVLRVRIRRIHMEEDAGKSVHDRFADRTAIDLNRSGVPLVEIVTEPDLHTAADARTFLTRLKQTLEYLAVSDCDMEKGSLRVDANVSVRAAGSAALGTKTELKNMNSFMNLERAVTYEIGRQTALLREGGTVVQQSLLWDAARGEARTMRTKEESHDYRYFPDPDLPPVVVTAAAIASAAAALPELPAARERRFGDDYGLPAYDSAVLTADSALADYFEEVVRHAADARAASNWVMMDVLGWLNQHGAAVAELPVSAVRLAGLIRLVLDGAISHTAGRQVFVLMTESDRGAADLVEEHGLAQVSDEAQLGRWIDTVVAEYSDEVARYRAGEGRVLGFLMGQVMKQSDGTADPKRASRMLRERLDS